MFITESDMQTLAKTHDTIFVFYEDKKFYEFSPTPPSPSFATYTCTQSVAPTQSFKWNGGLYSSGSSYPLCGLVLLGLRFFREQLYPECRGWICCCLGSRTAQHTQRSRVGCNSINSCRSSSSSSFTSSTNRNSSSSISSNSSSNHGRQQRTNPFRLPSKTLRALFRVSGGGVAQRLRC